MDISGNDYLINRFDRKDNSVNVTGLEGLEELRFVGTGYRLDVNIAYMTMFPRIQRLYLSNNNLFIPHDFSLCKSHPNITELDISDCNIANMSTKFLQECRHLTTLNVSHNQLTFIDPELRASFEYLQRFHQLTVDLSGNTFHCHCHSEYQAVMDMLQWMRHTKVRLVNADSYQCRGDKEILELVLEKDINLYRDMCSHIDEIIQGIVSTLVACITIAITVIATRMIYRRRYRIETWYYRLKYSRQHDESQSSMNFDVYLCFDQHDKYYAINSLSRTLEHNYGLSCCIPDRDFPGHGVYKTIVMNFIRQCRMTIVILSANSIKSDVQSFERILARDMELHWFRPKRIIYILLDDLGDITNADMPKDIARVLNAKIAIKWRNSYNTSVDQQLAFYERLRAKVYRALTSHNRGLETQDIENCELVIKDTQHALYELANLAHTNQLGIEQKMDPMSFK